MKNQDTVPLRAKNQEPFTIGFVRAPLSPNQLRGNSPKKSNINAIFSLRTGRALTSRRKQEPEDCAPASSFMKNNLGLNKSSMCGMESDMSMSFCIAAVVFILGTLRTNLNCFQLVT